MKNLTAFVVFFLCNSLFAQNPEFRMEFKLRFENQKIYCDVVPKEDYKVIALQFGIRHNSDQVEFDTLTSNVLSKVNRKLYNEICPRNVRILWTASDSKDILLEKDIPFLTLEYHEIIPSDHFICLMPSEKPSCTTMIREIVFTRNNELVGYDIPDVCVDYKIKDGVLLVGNHSFEYSSGIQLRYLSAKGTFYLEGTSNLSENLELKLFDGLGRQVLHRSHLKTGEELEAPYSLSGVYVFVLSHKSEILKTGKIVI